LCLLPHTFRSEIRIVKADRSGSTLNKKFKVLRKLTGFEKNHSKYLLEKTSFSYNLKMLE
jgi:hypothetical protein